MVEGGGRLIRKLLLDELIDQITIVQVPILVGGEGRPAMVGGPPFKATITKRFELERVGKVGGHPVVIYRRAG